MELWDSIKVLLERIQVPSIESLLQTLAEFQCDQLERLGLPMVPVGCGDFKRSNILWLPKCQEIQFLDFFNLVIIILVLIMMQLCITRDQLFRSHATTNMDIVRDSLALSRLFLKASFKRKCGLKVNRWIM